MKSIGSRRLQHMGSAIFSEIEGWKREAAEAGRTIIDLGIGSPDRPPSAAVMRALTEAVGNPENYRYPSSNGTLRLRRTIATWFAYKFGVPVDAELEVLVLMGTQDGLAHLGLALADEGDIAIVPDPGYPIYHANLALAAVRPHYLPLLAANQYAPDFAAIPKEVAEAARFMILNYPGNPLATTVDRSVLQDAIDFCNHHQIVLAHDFAYSEMLFSRQSPVSVLQLDGARHCAIEFHSFSKSFNLAGLRIGFAVGNERVISALRSLKANIDYGVFLAAQEAAVVALEEDLAGNYESVAALYEERSRRFVSLLHAFGWHVPQSTATMFVWAPIPSGWSSRQFAKSLLLHSGVVVTPGDAFGAYGEGFVRIALVRESGCLEEAAERMKLFWEEHVHGTSRG